MEKATNGTSTRLVHGGCSVFAIIYPNTTAFNQNTIILIEIRVSLLSNSKFKALSLDDSKGSF